MKIDAINIDAEIMGGAPVFNGTCVLAEVYFNGSRRRLWRNF